MGAECHSIDCSTVVFFFWNVLGTSWPLQITCVISCVDFVCFPFLTRATAKMKVLKDNREEKWHGKPILSQCSMLKSSYVRLRNYSSGRNVSCCFIKSVRSLRFRSQWRSRGIDIFYFNALKSGKQYNTIQYNTIQYNTIQYSILYL